MTVNRWALLEDHQAATLASLFADDPERVVKMTIEQSGLRFDFSKTHLDDPALDAFRTLADVMGLAQAKEALFTGAIVNPTEGRAAEHAAERGNGSAEAVAKARGLQTRMRGLVEAIDAGALGEIKHILHIGIGGSALGPKLLVDALGRDDARYDVKVVSNVDGAALAEAVKGMDPHNTIVAVASKTFTTTETLLNATSAMEWMRDGGVTDPYAQFVALTAYPDKAIEWGIDESRILPFNEAVGGRYSLWCSIGFPVALGRCTKSCLKAPPRWTGTFAGLICWKMHRLWPHLRISITRNCAIARRARYLPMTSGCAYCPIICSSWKWNRTASPSQPMASNWAVRARRSHGAVSEPTHSMRCSSYCIKGHILFPSNLSPARHQGMISTLRTMRR
jgi:Phosphoglucose isomerase